MNCKKIVTAEIFLRLHQGNIFKISFPFGENIFSRCRILVQQHLAAEGKSFTLAAGGEWVLFVCVCGLYIPPLPYFGVTLSHPSFCVDDKRFIASSLIYVSRVLAVDVRISKWLDLCDALRRDAGRKLGNQTKDAKWSRSADTDLRT